MFDNKKATNLTQSL